MTKSISWLKQAIVKADRPSITFLIGVPGSGKSTWLMENLADLPVTVISTDDPRCTRRRITDRFSRNSRTPIRVSTVCSMDAMSGLILRHQIVYAKKAKVKRQSKYGGVTDSSWAQKYVRPVASPPQKGDATESSLGLKSTAQSKTAPSAPANASANRRSLRRYPSAPLPRPWHSPCPAS